MPGGESRANVSGADVSARHHAGTSDELLMLAAQQDARHFTALYERYADRLYRYALGRTGSPEEAEDIVGETMISALESIDRFDPNRGSFASWIFTIAGRRIADRGRAYHRFRRFLRQWHTPVPQQDPSLEAALSDEEGQRVRQGISQLSTRHREVILLRYVADLPIMEIATTLGISEGAVKMRLQRATRSLAQLIEEESHE